MKQSPKIFHPVRNRISNGVKKILILILIICLAGGVGIYFYLTREEIPQPEELPTGKKETSVEEFLKETIARIDEGDLEFVFSKMVDEHGKKWTTEEAKQIKADYKKMVGENGENVTVESVKFLEKSKALNLDTQLPYDTSIKEIYNVKLKIEGKVENEDLRDTLLGIKIYQVAKIDNYYYDYRGKTIAGEIQIIYKEEGDESEPLASCKSEEATERDRCYHSYAAKLKDPSLCEKIETLDKKSLCYSDVAIAVGDFSICKKTDLKFPDTVINCYSHFARESKDISICDRIEESCIKERCRARLVYIFKDTSICDEMECSQPKDTCYQQLALAVFDSTLCEKISDPELKDLCYRQIEK